MKVAVVLALALLAVQNAEAGGKGFILGKGKGKGDVNVDVQCNQVCNDVCVPVPNKVCNEVPYQTQVCNKVPVQKTKQVCSKVCTQTYTQQVSTGKGAVVIPMSKGKGWGRHLLTKHGLVKAGFLGGKGKGAALVDTQCNDVCNDVQYTAYDTQCQQVTKTRTQCDTVYNQQCNKVCKPVCNKVTTVTTTQVVSGGKGVAVNIPISFSKGKGH